jgi:alkanesulfonate monooxygenase SsuD/methylene tetrahydromethanopterin reductase-like flavin-dependent oxidoreductase (luciferase family)
MERTERKYSIVLGQRLPWPEMLARARETEALGFDGLYLVDHFYGLQDIEQPTHEAYTMLAALAPFTQRVRLGVMVCGNLYRNPAFLLKQAITVDHISGGRVDFGVGAGWLEREHEAYGFDFPGAGERVNRFAEALEIWRLLQAQDRTTFEGAHYRMLDAPFQPKSLQPGGLPVLIGGHKPRMLRLVARYADIWNTGGSPEEAAETGRQLDIACAAEGRDPATLMRSVSPSINLLESPDAFASGAEAYYVAGFSHITLPWPRTEAEVPILRDVARDVLPALHAGPAPDSNAGQQELERPKTKDERRVAVPDATARAVLNTLFDHPGERLDGRAIMALTGIERHAQVTLALAALRAAFAEAGLAPPWTEAQRGWQIDADIARQTRARLAT